jgi:hypothetical protein
MLGDEMIDEASHKMARAIVAKAARPAWPDPETADRHFRARIGKTGLKLPLRAENSPFGKGVD